MKIKSHFRDSQWIYLAIVRAFEVEEGVEVGAMAFNFADPTESMGALRRSLGDLEGARFDVLEFGDRPVEDWPDLA